MTTRTGGCACGAVRYELTAEPVFQVVCHCRSCQYTAGGGPTLGMIIPKAGFKLTKGEPRIYWTQGDSGGRIGRAFYEVCGTPLYSAPEANDDNIVVIKPGSLDDPSVFAPQANLYTKDAQPWHRMTEGLMNFETMPG